MKAFLKPPHVTSLVIILSLLVPAAITREHAGAVSSDAAGRCASVSLIGHRGTNQDGVRSNTLPALQKAVAAGVDALEIDIWRTKPTLNAKTKKKSGVWVVNHDPTVERTVNGKVARKTITATKYTDLKKFAPDIMTFAQAVAYAKASGKTLYVEIKPNSVAKGSLQYFSNTIKKYDMQKQTIFTSFNSSVLKKYRGIKNYAGRISFITNKKLPATTAKLAAYAKDVRKFADIIIIRYTISNSVSVAAFKAAGLSVITYTTTNAGSPEVDNAEAWSTHINYGVDGIITDNAAGFTEWCKATSTPEPAPSTTLNLPNLEDPEEESSQL